VNGDQPAGSDVNTYEGRGVSEAILMHGKLRRTRGNEKNHVNAGGRYGDYN
jgi:hypothetical protein